MGDAIESAANDGKVVIGKDDANIAFDAAHWAGPWIGGKAPGQRDEAGSQAATGAGQLPVATGRWARGPVRSGRPARRRRYIPLASGVVAAAFLLVLVPRTADQPDSPLIGERLIERGPLQPNQASTIALPALPQGKADPTGEFALNGGQIGAEPPDLAEVRRTIGMLNAQLRAEAAKNERLPGQERDRIAALVQEAEAARQELTASTEQHRQALDQERARSAALAAQLAAAQHEFETQAAQLRKVSEDMSQLRQAEAAKAAQVLEQERQKTAALAQEIATAQHEIAAQAAQLRKASDETGQLKQSDAAKAAKATEQERQKTAALAQAAAARQALTANAAQHRQALDEERAQRVALAAELAAVRREAEAQAAQLRKANDEFGQLRQAEIARTAESFEQERQKTAALASAASARQDLALSVAQHRRAFDEERGRRAALEAELSTARRGAEMQTIQLRKAGDDVDRLRQATESTIAELRRALQLEGARSAAIAEELSSERAASARTGAAEPATTSPTSPQLAIYPAQSAAAEVRSSSEATRLIARASVLLNQGDIGSARVVLERAAEIGSARANFMLAETYDPRILSAWGTYGTRGEVARARELYAKAQIGGIREAKDRFDTLPQ